MKRNLKIIASASAACLLALVLSRFPTAGMGNDTPPHPPAGDIRTDPQVARLRALGPAGLSQLISRYESTHDVSLIPLIDQVAAQKNAITSRLFWYTSLSEAKAAAVAQNKPILYLRMLGHLSDEYSCANSRFFRTVLYADPSVSSFLSENFILVWESQRPVPIVTIEFPDGRKLRRTLVGNSIHYVLDKNGRIIDALPGLYSPDRFKTILKECILPSVLEDPKPHQLAALDNIALNWKSTQIRSTGSTHPTSPSTPAASTAAAPTSTQPAENYSLLKVKAPPTANPNPDPSRVVEWRDNANSKAILISDRVMSSMSNVYAREIQQAIKDADIPFWEKMSTRYPAKLSPQSIDVIRRQTPPSEFNQAALDKTVQRFQQSIAIDTAQNELRLRHTILLWLTEKPIDLQALNTRVYNELFLSPDSDPWQGLRPPSFYVALENDGIIDRPR
jgi:hypothetical protein